MSAALVAWRKVSNREAREYLRQIARALRARYGHGNRPGTADARQARRQGVTARIDPPASCRDQQR
jgi:hypothetical protein